MRNLSDWSYLWDSNKQDYVLLKVRDDAVPLHGCLIFNIKERASLIIEDNQLAVELLARMYEAGVPIVCESEITPGKNPIQQLVDDMIEAGKSGKEINEAIRLLTKHSPLP